jgi:trans-aconitate 2-methyltransferase
MNDWDADRYDRVSDPQFEWGRRVIARLAPRPGERILDLGCGTGRVTAEIAARLPGGCVVGLDRSSAMLLVARQSAVGTPADGPPLWLVQGDALHLPFTLQFDAVFTAATLHWIADHDAVFASIYGVLCPGGRLVGQCGGGPNLDRLYRRAATLMQISMFASHFGLWRDPWNFALPEPTRAGLRRAGFVDVDAHLESAPVTFDDASAYADFISCVCLRHHLEHLPAELKDEFTSALTRAASTDDPPYTLDYWRLNISARRPSA